MGRRVGDRSVSRRRESIIVAFNVYRTLKERRNPRAYIVRLFARHVLVGNNSFVVSKESAKEYTAGGTSARLFGIFAWRTFLSCRAGIGHLLPTARVCLSSYYPEKRGRFEETFPTTVSRGLARQNIAYVRATSVNNARAARSVRERRARVQHARRADLSIARAMQNIGRHKLPWISPPDRGDGDGGGFKRARKLWLAGRGDR